MSAPLFKLLTAIEDLEEGLLDLTEEQIKELIGDVRNKVDSIYEIITRLDSEEERLAKNIKTLTDRKRALANSRNRLKQYVVTSMETFEAPAIYGKVWDVKLQKRSKFNIREATLEDTYENNELVDMSFKFNRTKVLEAYNRGDEFAKAVVTPDQSTFIRFTAHKDVK
jgi:hypothetical protein